MDPSLMEIVAQAINNARKAGLSRFAQCEAAVTMLRQITPLVSDDTARLIVQQLYPLLADRPVAA